MFRRITVSFTFLVWLLLPWATTVDAADVNADPYSQDRAATSQGEFGYDDSDDIPWIENETQVLAVPAPNNLNEVHLDALPKGMTLAVDKSRINVNEEDKVVRLWLWMTTASGTQSGTFEGFRCSTFEYKVYAYANPMREPVVSKAKSSVWRDVHQSNTANYRLELMSDYLCGIRGVYDANQIRSRMSGNFARETWFSN